MSRRNRKSSRAHSLGGTIRRTFDGRRRLGFEPLEDRRLLAMITVNTLIDVNNGSDGLTTLREAVAAAAANDTISFSVTGTINLTSTGHITVNKSLTIQGPGANLLTIKAFDPDANGNNDSDGSRVFYVSNGSSSFLNVTFSGLTLTNGDPAVTDENKGGGAIYNEENLTVSACVLTGNFAPNGGAIYSPAGTLAITDCTITGNTAGDGGGLLIEGGSATITRTTISNNQVTNSGGGILDRGRPITIIDSTISGNSTDERGGGVYLYQGSLTVTGSTISGNISDANDDQAGSGGGIYNLGGGLNINSSTISGNISGEDGGGIFSDTSQTITINHSTIFGNSVTVHSGNDGAGIRSIDTATLNHTIVAGNLKGTTRDDVSGMFEASFSLIGDRRSTTVTNLGGSLIGTTAAPINPLLGPLANNGGRTMTHALLVGSSAIDTGYASAVAGMGGIPQLDQRGMPFSRVSDGDGASGARIDIGADEKQSPMNLVVDLATDESDFDYAAGDLSLREALALANWNAGTVDTISFSAALSNGTIGLTLGELPITDGVNISGLGANLLAIDASGNDPTPLANEGNGIRVFAIDDGAAGTFITVQISGLRLTGGDVNGAGGAILNRENLTLTAVEIGANAATTQGGGIKHELGNLTIVDSLLTANVAAAGGAIWSDTDLATHTTLITNSTISGNLASASGGGVRNENGLMVIRHSTITNNLAPTASGGGIASVGDANTRTEVNSTIVAGNSNDVAFVAGATNSFQSNNYNLVGSGNATGEFVESGDRNNVANPMLDVLANNGGPTRTRLPLPGSPAIDAGNPSAIAGSGGVPQFDQRGNPYSRILRGRIDIGAVETPAPALPGDYNLNGVVDGADYVLWRNTAGTNVAQYSGADGDGNGMIDNADYAVWRAQFGEVLMLGAGSMMAAAESSPPQGAATDANAAAAYASRAPSSGAGSAPLGASSRDAHSAAFGAAIDLLLTLAPVYEPAEAAYGSWMACDGTAAMEDGSAVDAALDDAGDAVAAAIDMGAW